DKSGRPSEGVLVPLRRFLAWLLAYASIASLSVAHAQPVRSDQQVLTELEQRGTTRSTGRMSRSSKASLPTSSSQLRGEDELERQLRRSGPVRRRDVSAARHSAVVLCLGRGDSRFQGAHDRQVTSIPGQQSQ